MVSMNNVNVNELVDVRGKGKMINNKGPGARLRSGERMCYQGSAKHLSFANFMKRHELTLHISYSEKKLFIPFDLLKCTFLTFR